MTRHLPQAHEGLDGARSSILEPEVPRGIHAPGSRHTERHSTICHLVKVRPMSYGSPGGPTLRTTSTTKEGRDMAEWEKQISAMTLVVGDLERSKTFYREVFGLPPLDEEEDLAVFGFKNMYVALRKDPAHQPPGREVLALAQKGLGQFSIWVENVDAVRAELDEHGVTLISGPADRDWGMRTITFADPDGYIWQIAQDLP
jgi:catechol 2,3-dioxygenase-like lactoylglutathione lyase family enzyme